MSDKSLTLAVTPSVKLRPNQAKLYEFILGKHKSGGTINLQEVIDQYSTYGNRMIWEGKPYSYVYNWEEHQSERRVLQGDELRMYAVQWFIRNLGIFVVKGLLTAIPTMELSDLQIEATDNGSPSPLTSENSASKKASSTPVLGEAK